MVRLARGICILHSSIPRIEHTHNANQGTIFDQCFRGLLASRRWDCLSASGGSMNRTFERGNIVKSPRGGR